MAEYKSLMGSGREEKMSMVMSTGNEIMVEAMGDDEEVKLAVEKSLAFEDYYRQQGRVWKFRSEVLDAEEFEVAAAGSGWMEEEDCDNFQRYLDNYLLSKDSCKQMKKQYTTTDYISGKTNKISNNCCKQFAFK